MEGVFPQPVKSRPFKARLIKLPLVFKGGMIVAFPTEVAGGFVNGFGNITEVCRYVVLEAFAANVLEQLLQLRNVRYASAGECLQRIVGEFAGASVAANNA